MEREPSGALVPASSWPPSLTRTPQDEGGGGERGGKGAMTRGKGGPMRAAVNLRDPLARFMKRKDGLGKSLYHPLNYGVGLHNPPNYEIVYITP